MKVKQISLPLEHQLYLADGEQIFGEKCISLIDNEDKEGKIVITQIMYNG